MPYTLSMALLWVVLAVVLGIVIGWLMRSVVAKRQVERARANHLDNVELDRMRARVAELETEVATHVARRVALEQAQGGAAVAAVVPEQARGGPVAPVQPDEPALAPGESHAAPDVDRAASEALGREVVVDDLTVVDGIGPTISELCAGIGITTWSDLASTEVSLLRTMLHDAGPRFRTHDPSSWPEQAALLAAGRWEEFRALTAADRVPGGTGEASR